MAMNFSSSPASALDSVSTFNPSVTSPAGSVSCWLSYDSGTGNYRPIGRETDWELRISSNVLYHEFFAGTANAVTTSVSSDTIYFIVMTWNSSTPQKEIWLDGVRVVNNTTDGFGAAASGTLSIGNRFGSSFYLDGWMDDVRIYTRQLAQSEIETMYVARGKDNIIDGLLHRWTFLEGTPNTTVTGSGAIKDMMGNLNLSPDGSPSWRESILNSLR